MEIPKTAITLLAIFSFITFLLKAFSLIDSWNTVSRYGLSNSSTTIAFLGEAFLAIFFLVASIICYSISTEDETSHYPYEKKHVVEEAVVSIYSGLEDAKYESMVKTLVNRSRNKGFLNPEFRVEGMIKDRMASGKTKEQAIEELYKQE